VFSLWATNAKGDLAVGQVLTGGPQTVRLTLLLCRTLTGRVAGPDGGAAPGAEVSAEWQGRTFRATTDGKGRYELGPIPAPPADQALHLQAHAMGNLWSVIDVLLRSTDRERVAVRDMVLDDSPRSVSGMVTDIHSRPMAGFVVEAYGPGQPTKTVRTDQKGRFFIDGLVKGKVWLRVQGSRSPEQDPVNVGAKDVWLLHRREDDPPD
jgi:hypothetical protein